MLRFFVRETVDSAARLWNLVAELQREKGDLCRERDYWRDKYLTLSGAGPVPAPQDATFPKLDEDDPGPIGRHFSIMALRARAEVASRAKKAELSKEKPNDAA